MSYVNPNYGSTGGFGIKWVIRNRVVEQTVNHVVDIVCDNDDVPEDFDWPSYLQGVLALALQIVFDEGCCAGREEAELNYSISEAQLNLISKALETAGEPNTNELIDKLRSMTARPKSESDSSVTT